MNQFKLKTSKVCAGLLVTLLASVSTPTFAKCISLQITLQGTIVGPTRDSTVQVEVASTTKGDSSTEVSQQLSIEESHFHVTAMFNTTSNVIRKETCDRNPGSVVVKLMKAGNVLDQQTLAIETRFCRTKEGDYDLIGPLVLHAAPGE